MKIRCWFTQTLISLRNKIDDQREIVNHLELDYFETSQTKINESFPHSNLLSEILRLGLEKIGAVMEVV